MPQLKPELYRLIAHYVRYPTEEEKKANPRIELANQNDVLNMMKASKTLHDACEIVLYTHPLVDNLTMFVDATKPPVKQDRWMYVLSLRLYYGRSCPPFRIDTFDDLRKQPVEQWTRPWIVGDGSSDRPIDMFPRLQTIVLHETQALMISRDRNGEERMVDKNMKASLLQIAAGKHLCQTGKEGPLDLQSGVQPAPSVATYTYHPRTRHDEHFYTPPPIILGAHTRYIFPWPRSGSRRYRSRLLVAKLQTFAINFIHELEDPDDFGSPLEQNLTPGDLDGTTLELFCFVSPGNLVKTSRSDRTLATLETAQRYLDQQMGKWAGIVKLRVLSDAPPCPACGYSREEEEGEALESGM